MDGLRPWLRAGLVLAAVVVLDQLSKHVVRDNVTPGDSNSVFPGVKIVHVSNKGVAFGAFAGGHTAVLVVIAVAVAALLIYFVRHAGRPLVWLPTGLLVGGAIGNIFDRIRDGAVTDFIKLPWWPAFNVADMAITFGVLALLYVFERSGSEEPTRDAGGPDRSLSR
jgi:signal peptidase II